MAYVSLYRKYRSQSFSDLIGQDHVVRVLQNGISSGRIAHSFLFTGPRGTGKTSSARLLAKALCCERGPIAEPCNECDICLGITEGSFIDVVEMDAASQTGVDDVRETIVQVVNYMPAVSRYKVFIIDEVHDLSPKAFDALLKTIEEPPSHMIFILATTEYAKVPPTVRSRCQKLEFHRASTQHLVGRLQHVVKEEGVDLEPAALDAIARMADGGFRDALTLLEHVLIASPAGKTITTDEVYEQLGLITEDVTDTLLNAIGSADVTQISDILNEQARLGRDPQAVVESLLYRLSDLTKIAHGMENVGASDSARLAASHDLAVRLGMEKILRIRSGIAQALQVIRDISLPRLWLESELIRLSMAGPVKSQAAAASAVVTPAVAKHAPPTPKQPAATVPEKAVQDKPEVVIESPQEQGQAVVESSGDPELDKAAAIWRTVLDQLPTVSQTMHNKLVDARVGPIKENELTIELARKHDLDWMNDTKGATKQRTVTDLLKNATGIESTVKYTVPNGSRRGVQAEAVELPLEGAKLADAAKRIYGS